MKTINFLTSHFIPENTACTNRVLSFVKELEKNYKINVICLTKKGEMTEHINISYSNNIEIFYVNQKNFNGRNFFKRAFYEIFYIYKLIKVSNKNKCDLAIATTPYMFMIPLVGILIKTPKILDIRDLVWEYFSEMNIVNKSIKYVLKFIMKKGIQRFDYVTVTNAYESNIVKKEYGIKNIKILFNGVSNSRYEELSQLKIVENSPFSVTYVGNIGIAQNILTLVNAAQVLEDIQFYIIGSGIELDDLTQYIKKMNIKNIILVGQVPWHMLERYYEKTSILYAQLDEKFISAVPSKLYEYASIGLPIIYGGVGQATMFVQELENATVVTPGNVDELVKAIELYRKKDVMISEHNRLLVKAKYLREYSSQSIVEVVDHIIK